MEKDRHIRMERRNSNGGNRNRMNASGRNSQTSSSRQRSNTQRSTTQVSNATRKRLAKNKKRRMLKKRVKRDLILLAMLIIAISIIFFCVKGIKKAVVSTLNLNVKPADVTVNHTKLTGNGIAEDRELLQSTYKWNILIQYDDDSYTVENMLTDEMNKILQRVYGENKETHFDLAVTDVDSKVNEIIKTLEEKWNSPAVNSEITAYDSENNVFTISDSNSGVVMDSDTLRKELTDTLNSQKYEATIQVASEEDKPTAVKEDYKVIATYVTHTTNNKLRNINVTLACKTVNGTILQTGEQFSYNGVVGERTEEKGYQLAGAYANGEHVQELGGGVCQLSSTIYNAAVDAGLQIDERVGHSYEPNYVTPGEDATVSFNGPDFKFTNNSGHSMGIRVSFQDNTVTVELVGVPILEEGVKQYMKSEKTEDTPIPDPTYEEDPTLPLGAQAEGSAGKMGSKWVTNIVKEKDGEIIADDYLHTTTYKGTGPVIKQNTSGLDAETLATLRAQQAALQAQQQAALQAQQQAAEPQSQSSQQGQ